MVGYRRVVSHCDRPSETRVPDIQKTPSPPGAGTEAHGYEYVYLNIPDPFHWKQPSSHFFISDTERPFRWCKRVSVLNNTPTLVHPSSTPRLTPARLSPQQSLSWLHLRSPAPKVLSCCNLRGLGPVTPNLVGTQCVGGRLTVPRRGWFEYHPILDVLHHRLHNVRPPAQLDLRTDGKRGKSFISLSLSYQTFLGVFCFSLPVYQRALL